MAKLTHEDILAYLEEATILELNDLVKAIEEKFDVTAAAPVAVAAAADAGAAAEKIWMFKRPPGRRPISGQWGWIGKLVELKLL